MTWSHSLIFSSTSFVDRYPGRVWILKRAISSQKVNSLRQPTTYAKVYLCSCTRSSNIPVHLLSMTNLTTTTSTISSILLCCRKGPGMTWYLTGMSQTTEFDGEQKPTISLF